jgi:Penicillin amidase
VRTEEPEPGLVIERDQNDIPHVFGQTRAEVMFGSGWVAAEDRGLVMALGLGPAFAAALGIPGINPMELLLHPRSFTPSAQTVNFVSQQKDVLLDKGPRGFQVLQDLEQWANGINAHEATRIFRLLPSVNATDAIAGFALIGSIFGNGGGNEVANSNLLAQLEAKPPPPRTRLGARPRTSCSRDPTIPPTGIRWP